MNHVHGILQRTIKSIKTFQEAIVLSLKKVNDCKYSRTIVMTILCGFIDPNSIFNHINLDILLNISSFFELAERRHQVFERLQLLSDYYEYINIYLKPISNEYLKDFLGNIPIEILSQIEYLPLWNKLFEICLGKFHVSIFSNN